MKSIENLNFYIGGFGGGYERVIWQNDKLHHQFFERNFNDDEEPDKVLNEKAPSTTDWEEFWQVVDVLKVWGFKILIIIPPLLPALKAILFLMGSVITMMIYRFSLILQEPMR